MTMKKIIYSLTLIAFSGFLFTGCKKSSSEDCEITEASIAGVYKLTAAKKIQGSTETDVLHLLYEDCELDDTNELKTDGTFVYTDAGVTCSTNNNETGTWSISGSTLILNSGTSTIESFDCKHLVVTYLSGSDTIKETYTRQ